VLLPLPVCVHDGRSYASGNSQTDAIEGAAGSELHADVAELDLATYAVGEKRCGLAGAAIRGRSSTIRARA
jgi:hypothetical protein